MMNRIQPENVHSNIFTPREYQVELLWQCLQQNTVSVLASSSTKIFLATCLCKELHYLYALATQKTVRETARPGSARAVIVGSSYTCLRRISKSIQQNTSLSVALLPQALLDVCNWTDDTWQLECLNYQVVLVTSAVAASFAAHLGLGSACLLFLADAQLCLTNSAIRKLIELVPRGCRLVGCTPPLLPRSSSAPSPPPHLLHAFIRRLRATTGCAVTTVSDLVAVIGNENRATEHVVVCGLPEPGLRSSTECEVRRLLAEARAFLFNHRYDPVEVYGEEYREFCAGVPDPKRQPTAILDNFEAVLNELGLWCCDRAALYALVEIEKLKKKTAYDRHYLLLCMVFTVMARIRIVIEECFDDHTELDQILNFSTPKVLRLIAILRRIRPLHFVDPRNRNKDSAGDGTPSALGGVVHRCSLHHVLEKPLDVGLEASVLSDDEEDDEEEENELNEYERSKMAEAVLRSYTYDDVIRDATVTEVTDDEIAKLNKQGWFGRSNTEEALQDDAYMHEFATEEVDNSRNSSRNRNVCSETDDMFCDNATKSKLTLKQCLVNRLKCTDDVDVESVESFQSCQDRLEELTVEERESSLVSDINGFRQYNDVQSSPDDLLVDKDKSVLTNGACSAGACLGLSCSKRVQHFSHGCDPSHCATVANISAKTSSGTNTPEVFSSCTASPIKCRNVSNGPSSVAILTTAIGNVSLRSMRDSASDSTSELKACDSQQQCDSTMAVNESPDESPLGGDRSSQTITKIKCINSASRSSAKVVTNGFHSMCTTCATSACVTNCDNHPSNEGLDSSNCNKLLDCSSEGFVADDRRHNESLHKNGEKSPSVSTEDISEVVPGTTSLTCDTMSLDPTSLPKKASEEVPGVVIACTCSASSAAAVTGASYLPVGQQQRAGGRRRRGDAEIKEKVKVHNPDDPDSVCGLIFVYNSNTAKMLYRLLKELSDIGGDFAWIFPQYTVEVGAGRCDGSPPDEKMLDADHKKQEEVLRRFRHLECNLLVATKVLEGGIDVPLCTLVVRFDPASCFQSYVQSGGRARPSRSSHLFHLVDAAASDHLLKDMATYAAYQQVLLENSSRKDGDSVVLSHNGEGDEWQQGRAPFSEQPFQTQASAPAPFCPLSSPDSVGPGEVPPSDLCRPYVTAASVVLSLSHAMQLLNRYCAKLPSDTFTRLTVQWQVHKKLFPKRVVTDRAADAEASVDGSTTQQEMYCCIIALPINSPFKDIIVGPWQPSSFLSKHCAAFSACVALHRLGELDDHLLPVGKESIQLEQHLCPPPASDLDPEAFPRPGTTKRRQYYYKKVAACLTSGCAIATQLVTATETAVRDSIVGTGDGGTKFSTSSNASNSSEGFFGTQSSNTSDKSVSAVSEKVQLNNTEECDGTHGSPETKVSQNVGSCSVTSSSVVRLYSISMVLRCAIPDQQNTRGRRIYRPELSPRDFGILTTHAIPQTGAFPVFTRSGEVLVSLTSAATSDECDSLRLSKEQLEDLNGFHQFTFTHVLRLEKYPIKFDPLKANASFFVVPLIVASGESGVARAIDWEFVSSIRGAGNLKPCEPLLDERRQFSFSRERYEDAVVMPWYRNHDQPQYFYVAEICDHLTPQSDFPDAGFETFEKYYLTKYGLQVCNLSQPLLDVDHTSARLNLLTPRHVNRKGVALPTTSEETKRAKRENLQQKQILVPELCSIHPFPSSLWRKAVCLPTVLYRINSLLLADELRVKVAKEIGLGMPVLTADHEWPALDFGWSLADVFKKSQEDEEAAKRVEETQEKENTFKSDFSEMLGKKEHAQKKGPPLSEMDDCESPPPTRRKKHGEMEIGTWSNEMAFEPREMADDLDDEDLDELDIFDPNEDLPDNLTILDGGCLVDNVDGELGSDWGTGIKERKSKSRIAGASVGRKRAPPRQTPNESSGGEQGMFRVGSPSNFEYDDGYDLSSGNSSRGDKRSGADGYEGYGDFDDDEDDFDCWDDYEAYSEGEESVPEEGAKHNTSNEWVAKGKKREEEEDDSDQEELDLMMGDVESDDLLVLEEQYTNLIEDRKTEILEGLGFIGNDEELKFEKARRPEQDVRRNENNVNREVDTVKDKGSPVVNLQKSFSQSDANKSSERACVQFGLDFDCIDRQDTLKHLMKSYANRESVLYPVGEDRQLFSFDHQPDLLGHCGPSPCVILQALTMSNANDGVNLERLETIGDSYLKYAITTYLYCMFPQQHEGKLSYLRSKQVSNLNLYRLGKYKGLGEVMVATKFEPHDNWLPPSYYVPRELEEALIASGVPSGHWNMAELPNLHELSSEQIRMLVHERTKMIKSTGASSDPFCPPSFSAAVDARNHEELPIFIPYNLLTQHSIPDKSIADSVEALIGAYLTTCGPKGALLFMAWLGIKVLPTKSVLDPGTGREKITFKQVGTPQSPLHIPKMVLPSELRYTPYFSSSAGSPHPIRNSSVDSNKKSISSDNSPVSFDTSSPSLFSDAVQLNSPISLPDPHEDLDLLLKDYDQFERDISYQFLDRGYLLQAFTHASFCRNRLTDCYQRLEFLGDAVLDYLITRHLYEDCRHHSPGALTDLRSALVNNTIFATLAVKHRFHKYFRHFSPGLDAVIRDFVKDQESNGHQINEEYYLLEGEVESDLMEDIEVPKALGDVFESVAGAIFLDSGCSLDAVWSVYFPMMQAAIAQFTAVVPKSPIRELLEMEPETAKFGRPERLVDGKVRVSVEIFGKGSFCGVGRNYRIAKSTAAKRALRHLRRAAPAQA